MLYSVEIVYKAKGIFTVQAEEEGMALGKAREAAEDADINEFVLEDEMESRIVNVSE
jgi:ketol-acid reductoisomerase